MAWQYPKHNCGHDGECYQAYGKTKDRDKALAALERKDCPECRRKAADEASVAAGLPLLCGTDKQVAWAFTIRERKIRLSSEELAEKLKPETSASWWIANGKTDP